MSITAFKTACGAKPLINRLVTSQALPEQLKAHHHCLESFGVTQEMLPIAPPEHFSKCVDAPRSVSQVRIEGEKKRLRLVSPCDDLIRATVRVDSFPLLLLCECCSCLDRATRRPFGNVWLPCERIQLKIRVDQASTTPGMQ